MPLQHEARDLHFFHLTDETLTCLLHLNILFYTISYFYTHQLYHLITHNNSFNNRLFHFFRSLSNTHPHLLKYLIAFRI